MIVALDRITELFIGLNLGLSEAQIEEFNIYNYHQMDTVLEKLVSFENERLDFFFQELISRQGLLSAGNQ